MPGLHPHVVGLQWVGPQWVGLQWVGLQWVGLQWVGLQWVGLQWVSLHLDEDASAGGATISTLTELMCSDSMS